MEEIVKNKYYEVSVDQGKNRVFFSLIGFWENANVVPDLYDDCMKAVDKVKPGYTILANLKDFKTPPPEVIKLTAKVQESLVKRGASKSAEVLDSMLVKYNMDKSSEASGLTTIQLKQFDNVAAAVAWLDE